MTRQDEDAPVTSDFVRSCVVTGGRIARGRIAGGRITAALITGGRRLPSEDDLALRSLVCTAPERTLPLGAGPEVRAIWELCSGGCLSVAEVAGVAGHLGLPVGVARPLRTELCEQGHLLCRAEPAPAQHLPRATFEKVLHGLETLTIG
ncbi:DUF742 domain-containing protein [Streptomyces griseorubiginosus]|uniref:DUF742 domain-containing protein n=1 Tax=Streptomyces griseorubiginosus TaxID=67304 RepID=A0AAI8KV57_9ACTN|nr:DUF742 domain-containing protein [Streptomyces griseorubiginosus]AYC36570.1 hypothetical protein DWG14_00780 [Streptomyces griseorubiginosus]